MNLPVRMSAQDFKQLLDTANRMVELCEPRKPPVVHRESVTRLERATIKAKTTPYKWSPRAIELLHRWTREGMKPKQVASLLTTVLGTPCTAEMVSNRKSYEKEVAERG